MDVWTDQSSAIATVLANSPNSATNGDLVPMYMCGTPLPNPQILAAAGFILKKPDKWTPERDMLPGNQSLFLAIGSSDKTPSTAHKTYILVENRSRLRSTSWMLIPMILVVFLFKSMMHPSDLGARGFDFHVNNIWQRNSGLCGKRF